MTLTTIIEFIIEYLDGASRWDLREIVSDRNYILSLSFSSGMTIVCRLLFVDIPESYSKAETDFQ